MSIVDKRITGRRWRRPQRVCPSWCAQDHQCTAQHGHPNGEHRSDPLVWSTPYGRLVATRVQHITGGGRMEIRVTARLAEDEGQAHAQAQRLAVRIDETVRAVMAAAVAPCEPTGAPITARHRAALHR